MIGSRFPQKFRMYISESNAQVPLPIFKYSNDVQRFTSTIGKMKI